MGKTKCGVGRIYNMALVTTLSNTYIVLGGGLTWWDQIYPFWHFFPYLPSCLGQKKLSASFKLFPPILSRVTSMGLIQWATKPFACLEDLDCASNRRQNKMLKIIKKYLPRCPIILPIWRTKNLGNRLVASQDTNILWPRSHSNGFVADESRELYITSI